MKRSMHDAVPSALAEEVASAGGAASSVDIVENNRFMSWRDIVITPLVECAILGLSAAATWAAHGLLDFDALGAVFALYLFNVAFSMMAIRLILFVSPVPPGVYTYGKDVREIFTWNLVIFIYIVNLNFQTQMGFIPPPMRKIFYGLLGAKFGKGIISIGGSTDDPWLISVAENVMLGVDSRLIPHVMTPMNAMVLARIEVERGAIIGAHSVLMGGVTVGEGAMVNALSFVPMNTRIGAYEVWGGNPAKKIRDLPRPSVPQPAAPAVEAKPAAEKARENAAEEKMEMPGEKIVFSSPVIVENVLSLARSSPDRLFAKLLHAGGPEQCIRYGDLLRGSSRYANLFRARGVPAGQVVILILDHGADLLDAFVGAMRAGVVPSIFAVPSTKVPRDVYCDTLVKMVEQCGTPFLLTNERIAGELAAELNDRVSLMTTADAVRQRDSFDDPPIDPDAVAFLQHSSGTTGLKKGVALTHRSVMNQLTNCADALRLTSSDKIVSWLPLYHDMGLIACFMLPVTSGVPVIMMSPFEWVARPVMLLEAITRERATLCWLPNFAHNLLATRVSADELAAVDLGSLRAFINCSEPVSARSHRLILDKLGPRGLGSEALAASYAMAENTFAVTIGGIEEPLRVLRVDSSLLARDGIARESTSRTGRELCSSGRVIAGNEVRAVDGQRRPLEEGKVGELAIKSDSLMTGYHRRPDLTREALEGDWYYTGDMGFIRDGHVFVTGRKKDMIIVAGKNIYPQDLEEVASSVSGVYPGRVVAFGIDDDEKGTERVVVLAETRLTDSDARTKLRRDVAQAIRERLECVADDVELVPHMWLLKSSSGKIARSANRDRYLQEHGLRQAQERVEAAVSAGPSDEVAAALRTHIACTRRVDPSELANDTTLFSSGILDSLDFVTLVSFIDHRFGVRLSDVTELKIETLDRFGDIVDHTVRARGQASR